MLCPRIQIRLVFKLAFSYKQACVLAAYENVDERGSMKRGGPTILRHSNELVRTWARMGNRRDTRSRINMKLRTWSTQGLAFSQANNV